MNLACSGLAPNTREADWLAIAGDNEKLQNGMERLYRLFQKAAVLGSLINPRAGEGDLLVAAFHELQPLLEKALAQETKDDTAHEMAVTARGLAKAAEILAGQFTLVATNVPYLGRGLKVGRFPPRLTWRRVSLSDVLPFARMAARLPSLRHRAGCSLGLTRNSDKRCLQMELSMQLPSLGLEHLKRSAVKS